MMIVEILILTLVWSINGQEQSDPKNTTYLYLQMPNNMPLKDQYPQRVGFPRGTVGTKIIPVIFPPRNREDNLKSISLYISTKQETVTVENFCSNKLAYDFSSITKLIAWFAQQKSSARLVHKSSNMLMSEFTKQFVASVSAARLEFIHFYCFFRHRPVVQLANEQSLDLTFKPYADLYGFCPSPCGNREGPGMDSTERALLDRFSKPCSYPQNRLIFTSRKCVQHESVPIVHRETFKCSCQGNGEWQEQLKTCRFCLFTREPTQENVETTSPGAPETATNNSEPSLNCHREGTQYIGGIGLDADTGGDEVIRSKHQILRCVCKPQYYGSLCDKLKDPCTMSIGTALPGQVACNVVHNENKCIPHFKESRYTCKCGDNFKRINWRKNLPPGRLLDNCLRQKDPCAAQGCMHGICVLSDLGSTMEYRGKLQREPFSWIGRVPQIVARCLCNAGWTGEKCSFPLVLNGWSPWSPWTACEPKCQTSIRELPPYGQKEMVESSQSTPRWGIRQRTRYRDCMGDASDCHEEIRERSAHMGVKMMDSQSWRQYERRACRPRPCDRHLYLAMGKRAVKRSKIMKQVRETLKQAYTVHLWTVLAFTFVFAIFGFVAAFATKMHSEKVFENEMSQDSSRLRVR